MIRERRTVTQDLVDTQRELNEASEESLKTEAETALNLETVNKLKEEGVDVEKVLANLEKQRREDQINNLAFEIALLEKNSQERIDKEKELSELLLEEQQERLEKEAEAEEKAAQRRVEVQEAAFSAIERLANNATEKRLEQIDALLDAEREREDELREHSGS